MSRIWSRIGPLLLPALLLSSCSVGPDYSPPELSIADEWSGGEDSRAIEESADHGDWWTSFKDPVLEELIALAHRENLTLRMAALQIAEARAQLGRAVGNLYPQSQQGFGSYSRVKLSGEANPVPLSGLPLASDLEGSFDNYQLGLGAVLGTRSVGEAPKGSGGGGCDVYRLGR